MCWTIILLSLLSSQPRDEMKYLLGKIPDAEIMISDSVSRNISYWYSQEPVVLTFAYGRCPGVCNPYLLQIRDHVSLQGAAAEDFQMMVLSFDPDEDLAKLRKLAGFADDSPPPANWIFGILKKESKASLLASLDFQNQIVGDLYEHNTVLALIGTDGKILQRVEGLPTTVQWMRLFKELAKEFVPVYSTLGNEVWTSCFRYDPASGIWRMNWGLLLILAPSIATVCLLVLLGRITSSERKKHNHSTVIQNDR